VIGVLNLEAKAPDAFDAHVEQLLTAFANQLAIAVENARLYEQVKRDAEVKATLLRELSHRVKNNLAAITSLLYMALDEPAETREQILNETLGRVQSMALAHALLARSGEARVGLLELGRQVLHDTVRNLVRPGIVVETELDGPDVQVAARQTTTLALVLNELATNALRHGLDGGALTHLRLRFIVAREGQEVYFQLQDDGKGVPTAFELFSDAGLGLNLVRTLVEKDLHGRFALERRGVWTSADVRFRLEEDAR
jgi:two-component sensor histidine kinase